MRIKIIGDNNCARATRHLLRLAGFAVTEFLPADAAMQGPHAGYAITIDVAPANAAPADLAPANLTPDARLGPDHPTHEQRSATREEAARLDWDASSPAFAPEVHRSYGGQARPGLGEGERARPGFSEVGQARRSFSEGGIHFDSVECALEAAVLRHVTQLAAAPVIVDRPGGVVHSDRELRIVVPQTGDTKADEAAAVAVEFGVLRGLLDLVTTASPGKAGGNSEDGRSAGGKKRWWALGVLLVAGALGAWRASSATAPAAPPTAPVAKTSTFNGLRNEISRTTILGIAPGLHPAKTAQARVPVLLKAGSPRAAAAVVGRASACPVLHCYDRATAVALVTLRKSKADRLKPVLLAAQGQFATGAGIRITDGNDFLVIDPCKGQAKSFASINQTGNTQLVAGTTSEKVYVCSIHVVVAAATNVAVVEGTGSACGTGTAGVNGFGGATAATGWNFAANGGIALGNGDSSLGAEGTSGDNLCVFSSGSGQVSGGISYVVQ